MFQAFFIRIFGVFCLTLICKTVALILLFNQYESSFVFIITECYRKGYGVFDRKLWVLACKLVVYKCAFSLKYTLRIQAPWSGYAAFAWCSVWSGREFPPRPHVCWTNYTSSNPSNATTREMQLSPSTSFHGKMPMTQRLFESFSISPPRHSA